uniref:Uncharacterized protein n=1 Tax=Plectus sambesii TaxID=2011161 RepID=A0A914X3R2_9BILA
MLLSSRAVATSISLDRTLVVDRKRVGPLHETAGHARELSAIVVFNLPASTSLFASVFRMLQCAKRKPNAPSRSRSSAKNWSEVNEIRAYRRFRANSGGERTGRA